MSRIRAMRNNGTGPKEGHGLRPELIELLSRPSAYRYEVSEVEVRQTHISAVFLAGRYAFKVKKPVNLGFLDVSTLEKREHFCQEEVRLNRRLAPDVYLGVVPVVRTPTGVQWGGEGEVVDWAVKMQRLPETATLRERLLRGELGVDLIENVARKLAAFHQAAETSEHIATLGRFEHVSRVILDIYDQAVPQLGTSVSRTVFDRLKTMAAAELGGVRTLVE